MKTASLAVQLTTLALLSSAAVAAPVPPPPSPPPISTNPCAGDPVASILGRKAQRHWTCGPVQNAFGATAGYSGGSYATAATPAANCNEGVIVWNPHHACAYTIVNSLSGPAGKIHERWTGSAEVRAFVGYPAEDGIPLKTHPSQRFDYGHLAVNAAGSGAFVIGGRATVTGSATTSVRFPTFTGGVPSGPLQALLFAWAHYPGYTSGSFAGYKRPAGHTQHVSTNGGGFLTTVDGTLIGSGNDATVAVKSGASAGRSVAGAIQDYWLARGGVGGPLRWPTTDNVPIVGGQYVSFEGTVSEGCTSLPCATVYSSATYGTHAVDGRILMEYQGAGATGGALGFPSTDAAPVTAFPRAQHFQGGAIAALTPGFSYLVPGAIGHYWRTNGGGSGFLGWPADLVVPIAPGIDYQPFERGIVYRRGSIAFGVEGAPSSPILAKYLALGGPTGHLGHPTNTAPSSGTSIYPRTQTFQHGSITATSATTTSFEPHAPAAFVILGWGTDAAGLSWTNRSAPQTLVQRRNLEGAWVTVHSFGELAYDTVTTYEAPAETGKENCYRVVGTDGTQEAPSPVRCVYTRDGRGITVSQLQLRIRIPNGPVGGLWPQTDGSVQVRLQSPDWLGQWRPAGNSTWLDSAEDDFEMGSDHTYDLRLTRGLYDRSAIRDLSDITQITVDVPGSDGLCIAELELLADGHAVFQKTFGDATCAWAQDGHPVSVGFQELRDDDLWDLAHPRIFTGFDGTGLRSLMEMKFGNALHGQGGHLRDGHPTQIDWIDKGRVHLRVHMIVAEGWLGEVTTWVDFDLALRAEPGEPTRVVVENVDADSQYLGLPIFEILPNLVFTLLPILDLTVDLDVETAMENMGGAMLGVPPDLTHFCFVTPEDPGLGLCAGEP